MNTLCVPYTINISASHEENPGSLSWIGMLLLRAFCMIWSFVCASQEGYREWDHCVCDRNGTLFTVYCDSFRMSSQVKSTGFCFLSQWYAMHQILLVFFGRFSREWLTFVFDRNALPYHIIWMFVQVKYRIWVVFAFEKNGTLCTVHCESVCILSKIHGIFVLK